ncbi:SAM-dependent methyltransferase [Catellatospora tritici]|uniref:SAM-dependent methyltransferase n=1 Tax=Catellatospora tritici TaxID=2851566 RepID=UPI001C2D8601|nr:class I SAM-dependent methyltransferase [Catellatospora tritici]MBV1853759.1 class I SAM-dependent methyltransferase [Catellatospora tritici]
MSHDHPDTRQSDEQLWEERYRGSEQVWSGKPNAALVREATGLTPGMALDLGCGEGADAIWLAAHGWRVTAVDISPTALRRGASHAAVAGLGDHIDWQRHDLAESFPAGRYDLVSVCFLHSRGPLPWRTVLRTAAAAVLPGGVLLVVGHCAFPSWHAGHHDDVEFPSPDDVLAALALPDHEWEVLVSQAYEFAATGPEGQPGTRSDSTVKVRRLAD